MPLTFFLSLGGSPRALRTLAPADSMRTAVHTLFSTLSSTLTLTPLKFLVAATMASPAAFGFYMNGITAPSAESFGPSTAALGTSPPMTLSFTD
jgi:hypothetical protein